MLSGKLFRQILDKFLVSPVVQNARVQVCLPDGSFYDIKEELKHGSLEKQKVESLKI